MSKSISQQDFNSITVSESDKTELLAPTFSNEELASIQDLGNKPVEMQKEMAAKLYLFLNYRIKRDMAEKQNLSDFTRRWMEFYNSLLDSIHTNLYGSKSVSINLHKISHSQVASVVRNARKSNFCFAKVEGVLDGVGDK